VPKFAVSGLFFNDQNGYATGGVKTPADVPLQTPQQQKLKLINVWTL
jgi:hypothetical protein